MRSFAADNSLVGRAPGSCGGSGGSGSLLGSVEASLLGGALGLLGVALRSRLPLMGRRSGGSRSDDDADMIRNVGVDIVKANRIPKRKKKRQVSIRETYEEQGIKKKAYPAVLGAPMGIRHLSGATFKGTSLKTGPPLDLPSRACPVGTRVAAA